MPTEQPEKFIDASQAVERTMPPPTGSATPTVSVAARPVENFVPTIATPQAEPVQHGGGQRLEAIPEPDEPDPVPAPRPRNPLVPAPQPVAVQQAPERYNLPPGTCTNLPGGVLWVSEVGVAVFIQGIRMVDERDGMAIVEALAAAAIMIAPVAPARRSPLPVALPQPEARPVAAAAPAGVVPWAECISDKVLRIDGNKLVQRSMLRALSTTTDEGEAFRIGIAGGVMRLVRFQLPPGYIPPE